MANFRNVRTEAGTVTFAKGETRTLDLPRDLLIRKIDLNMEGTLNIATAAATGFTKTSSGILELIQELAIVMNGNDFIKLTKGEDLWHYSKFVTGNESQRSNPALTVGANPFSFHIPIYFASPLAIKPIDTLLDPRRATSLQVRIRWATIPAAADGELLDVAATTTGVSISGEEMRVTVHQTTQPAEGQFAKFIQVVLEEQAPTSVGDLVIDLEPGDIYRELMILSTNADATPGGAFDSGTIGHFSVRTGTNIFWWRDIDEFDVRTLNQEERLPGLALREGLYLLDFVEDGRLVTGLDSSGLKTLQLVLDIDNVTTIQNLRILQNRIRPVSVVGA